MASGKDEVVRSCNENDGPGRCGCWIHRRRRLAAYGAPYDEYQGTDQELIDCNIREGRQTFELSREEADHAT